VVKFIPLTLLALVVIAYGQQTRPHPHRGKVAGFAVLSLNCQYQPGKGDMPNPRNSKMLLHIQALYKRAGIKLFEVGLGTRYLGVRPNLKARAKGILIADSRRRHYRLNQKTFVVPAWVHNGQATFQFLNINVPNRLH
jgi:hypothetical protein